MLLTGCGSTKVDANDYVTITYDGYDGYATASAEFDYEKFEEDYEGKIDFSKEFKKELKDEYSDFLGDSASTDQLLEEVYGDSSVAEIVCGEIAGYGSFDKSDNLKNGDTVTYKWSLKDSDLEEFENNYNVKLKFSDIESKVDGLESIPTFDAFEGVEVTFDGTAPNGTASLSADNQYSSMGYTLDKQDGLKNGDVVTVTFGGSGDETSTVENCISSFQEAPKEVTKEYTVSGLPSYATKASEIPDDILEKMKTQATDEIKASVAKEWDKSVTLKSSEYVGNYFMMLKNTSDAGWYDTNCVYLIYKNTAHIDYSYEKDSYTEDYVYYTYIGFKNIMILEDGTGSVDLSSYLTCSDSTEVDTGVSNGWYGTQVFRFYGFDDLMTFENKYLIANMDAYTYENNVTEQK